MTRLYQEAGIPIWRWVTADYFEGGDFVLVEPSVALLGYSGPRSNRESAEQVAGWIAEQAGRR